MKSELKSPDPVQELIERCHAEGKEAALETGDQRADQARIEMAKSAISTEVRSLYRGPLDRDSPRDALIVESYEAAKENVRRLETTIEQARRNATAARQNTPADEPPPEAPVIVIVAAILALALTFAMSLADLPLLSEIDDSVLRLAAAAAMGMAIAGVCITSLFNLTVHNEKASVVKPKSTREFWSVIAGLAIVLAFGFVRLSTSGDDMQLTCGLMGIDAGVMAYAKAAAAQYRNKQQVHAERNDARIQWLKNAADLQAEFLSSEKRLTEGKEIFDQAKHALEYRLSLHFDVALLTETAIAAWRNGYATGMDMNRAPEGGPKSAAISTMNRRSAVA